MNSDLLLSKARATPPPLEFQSFRMNDMLSLCDRVFRAAVTFLFPLLNHVSVNMATIALFILKFVLSKVNLGAKLLQFIKRKLNCTSKATCGFLTSLPGTVFVRSCNNLLSSSWDLVAHPVTQVIGEQALVDILDLSDISWTCWGVSTPRSGLGLRMVKELDLQLALGMNERR